MDFGMSEKLYSALEDAYPEYFPESVAENMCWYCLEHPEWLTDTVSPSRPPGARRRVRARIGKPMPDCIESDVMYDEDTPEVDEGKTKGDGA